MSITTKPGLSGVESGEPQPASPTSNRNRSRVGGFVTILVERRPADTDRNVGATNGREQRDEPARISRDHHRDERERATDIARQSEQAAEHGVMAQPPPPRSDAARPTQRATGDDAVPGTAPAPVVATAPGSGTTETIRVDAQATQRQPIDAKQALLGTEPISTDGAVTSSGVAPNLGVMSGHFLEAPIGQGGDAAKSATDGKLTLDAVTTRAAVWQVDGRQIQGQVLRGPVLEAPPIFVVPPFVVDLIEAAMNQLPAPTVPTVAVDPAGEHDPVAAHTKHLVGAPTDARATPAPVAVLAASVPQPSLPIMHHVSAPHVETNTKPDGTSSVQPSDGDAQATPGQAQQVDQQPTGKHSGGGETDGTSGSDADQLTAPGPTNLSADGIVFTVPGRTDAVAAAPPASPDDGNATRTALLDRIVEQIGAQARTGPMSIRVRLDADEHGQIDVRLVHRNGAIEVQLIAADPRARDALERGIDHLRRGLADGGLQVQRLEVSAPAATADAAASGRNDTLGFQQPRGGQWSAHGQPWQRQPTHPDVETPHNLTAERNIEAHRGGNVSPVGVDYRA